MTINIGIIGGGISGLGALYYLDQHHLKNRNDVSITLLEKNAYIGGHANTVVTPDDGVAVDTGFIVYNPNNYPGLIELFEELQVPTAASDMSFAASIDGLEYGSRNLGEIFGQRKNIFKPKFYRLLLDILKFYKQCPAVLENKAEQRTLGQYLADEKYSQQFIDQHIIPMGAAIWSTPAAEMMAFPVQSFVQFFKNHQLLQVKDRPVWRTVKGGSREYVKRLLSACSERVTVRASTAVNRVEQRGNKHLVYADDQLLGEFDHIIMACHSDTALSLLAAPTEQEQQVLGAFIYQDNIAYLHRDASLMPKTRKVWSSWNYLQSSGEKLCLTYWMNALQPIETSDLFVTLNPPREPANLLAAIPYRHPVYDAKAIANWPRLQDLQGMQGLWYCGAYHGYGFHEDGLQAGKRAAAGVAEKVVS